MLIFQASSGLESPLQGSLYIICLHGFYFEGFARSALFGLIISSPVKSPCSGI